jgi:16S rRNA (cytosine1402-N4)-methyltransferase
MQIENALEDVPDVLNTRGRLVVISFHSLEDRIVKKYIETQAKYYDSPSFRNMPIIQYYKPSLKWQAKKIRPDSTELTKNPRARSAIMRVAERL